ncbi:hypothetical protein Dfri01_23840 [Dyadobacter frigoris]|nr:hypothetical protein Dfri01_23840 [Dyadobacter frigoris]
MLISAKPAKKRPVERLSSVETFPNLIRKQAAVRLKNAQRILINGEDKPFPGGFEKGVGKVSPVIPLVK